MMSVTTTTKSEIGIHVVKYLANPVTNKTEDIQKIAYDKK